MATKKVVDKWKSKKWYNVISPEIFGKKKVGEIVSSDESNLLNRRVSFTLDTLTGSFALPNPYTIVKFRIVEVKGNNCYTEYDRHELVFSYLTTLIRRRKSLIDYVEKFKTKDNKNIKIKFFVVTQHKCSRRTRTDIRNKLKELYLQKTAEMTLDELLSNLFYGKLSVDTYNQIKKIFPISRFEIKKIELIRTQEKKKEQQKQGSTKSDSTSTTSVPVSSNA
ncbi:MAG: hypothetical protein N3E37_01950 [Candidatus Micrarchaeota archaeon]|nr:hypothetical protein [Candidatus Micrarchaeota archaeon]